VLVGIIILMYPVLGAVESGDGASEAQAVIPGFQFSSIVSVPVTGTISIKWLNISGRLFPAGGYGTGSRTSFPKWTDLSPPKGTDQPGPAPERTDGLKPTLKPPAGLPEVPLPAKSSWWSWYRPPSGPPVPEMKPTPYPSWEPTFSPVPTVVPTPSPTGAPLSEVVISDFSPSGEYVTLANTGFSTLKMTGWKVTSGKTGNSITFIDFPLGDGSTFTFELGPLQRVTIYSGKTGQITARVLYWPVELFNKAGDTVYLINPQGNVADSRSV
jgi:hypothetical protein